MAAAARKAYPLNKVIALLAPLSGGRAPGKQHSGWRRQASACRFRPKGETATAQIKDLRRGTFSARPGRQTPGMLAPAQAGD